MFGITFGTGSFHPNFNFGNIEYLTYGLYFGDIFLLIMTLGVILGILGIGHLSLPDFGSGGDSNINYKKGHSYKGSIPDGYVRTGRNNIVKK